MNSTDQNPKLPAWIFVLSDLVLVGAAILVGLQAPKPLSTLAIVSIVICVGLGALIALVPIVARFERLKNEQLDDRQRALEGLARTVTSTAEQISIATGSLHDIAEIAQKNLRQAEQLPQKLQEKVAELRAQIENSNDLEKEELEKEVATLRASESERLETVVNKITKASAEIAKLEAATQQHLAGANEALGKLALGTAGAIGKAQAAAEQALAQARVEAAKGLGETSGQGIAAVEKAKAAALAELEAKLNALGDAFAERLNGIGDALTEKLSREVAAKVKAELAAFEFPTPPAPAAAAAPAQAIASAPASEPATPPPQPAPETPALPIAAEPAPVVSAPATTESPPAPETPVAEPAPAAPPKRSRKPRREEPVAEPATAAPPTPPAETAPAAHANGSAPEASASVERVPEAAPVVAAAPAAPALPAEPEPAPLPPEKFARIEPVAPHTENPFPPNLVEGPGPAAPAPAADASEPVPPAPAPEPVPAVSETPRKRAKAPPPEPEPTLDLGVDEGATAAATGERVRTSDGATRLLVTAYIGIGNRLFIRGEGPGLSWEKGVPLQFVSIGKWRWETNDASTPVRFKLFKNDEAECASLGAQSLDPGQQQEVTAAF